MLAGIIKRLNTLKRDSDKDNRTNTLGHFWKIVYRD